MHLLNRCDFTHNIVERTVITCPFGADSPFAIRKFKVKFLETRLRSRLAVLRTPTSALPGEMPNSAGSDA